MRTNLTGSWCGVFSYPDDMIPITFEARLYERDGIFSGLIHEMDDDGRGLMHLTAIIEGARHGREVDFRKTYDEVDQICIVDYVGTLDPDGVQIAGEWVRLNDLMTGSFVMQRQGQAEQEVDHEFEAEVPLDRQAPKQQRKLAAGAARLAHQPVADR